MKPTLIILIFLFIGCESITKQNRIIEKSYLRRYGSDDQLPKCTCFYSYYTGGNMYYFQDSCNKYNVGDSIK